jgi:hypothetical protein
VADGHCGYRGYAAGTTGTLAVQRITPRADLPIVIASPRHTSTSVVSVVRQICTCSPSNGSNAWSNKQRRNRILLNYPN